MNRYPDVGTLIGAKYRIVAPLGVGGMGAVFRARNELIDKEVALKVLNPRNEADPVARDRFLREARFAARIRHPHVVEIYDVGVDDEYSSFLVMELLEGETFANILDRRDDPIKDMLTWLCQGMRGVAVAHRMGVIHRDVKPENLFVSYDEHHPKGLAKVLDFGISKLVDPLQHAPITVTGVALGTPAYMSMEQLCGAGDLDVRTDIYSFGVLLYRVLTGRLPFEQKSLPSLAFAIATETPPGPRELRPDLPAALADIVSKAISRDREQRFATMNELIEALAPWVERSASLSTSQQAPALVEYKTGESLAPVELATHHVGSTRPGLRKALVWSAAVAVVLGGLGLWLAGSRQPTAAAPAGVLNAAAQPGDPLPPAAAPAPAAPPPQAAATPAADLPPSRVAATPAVDSPPALSAEPAPPTQKAVARKRGSRKPEPPSSQASNEPTDKSAASIEPDLRAQQPTTADEGSESAPSRTAAGKRSGTLRQDEL